MRLPIRPALILGMAAVTLLLTIIACGESEQPTTVAPAVTAAAPQVAATTDAIGGGGDSHAYASTGGHHPAYQHAGGCVRSQNRSDAPRHQGQPDRAAPCGCRHTRTPKTGIRWVRRRFPA